MPPVLRSVLAVIAGFVAVSFVLVVLSAFVSHPKAGQWGLELIYKLVAAAIGGFVTGLVAPSRPVLHGGIVGGLLLFLNGLALARNWGFAPVWYELGVVLGTPACVVLGAFLCGWSARRATA